MGDRMQIGILYENNENWIGGTYYIQNLIAAFNKLDTNHQPQVVVFCKTKEEFEQIVKTGYPYLVHRPLVYKSNQLSILKRIVNKLFFKTIGFLKYSYPVSLDLNDISAIFPTPVGLANTGNTKKIYWIPDFQEVHYPKFFSKEEIWNRKQNQNFIVADRGTVIFSSRQAENDFKRLYPKNTCKTYVLQFAVTQPVLPKIDSQALKKKYGIERRFYIAPNQFWQHKNQKVIIEAVSLLNRQKEIDFEIIFTGKEYDYRNPNYAQDLKELVKRNGIEEFVKFLGFIDRMDQLCLIDQSIALLQPSLFEGWSTVVEDGKAQNKFIIASDIPVHREQLVQNAAFFPAEDAKALAAIIQSRSIEQIEKLNYNENIKRYADTFLHVVSQ